MVYKEGIYEESLFSKLANIHENVFAVKLDGITKEDYAWGLRVGFITYASKGIKQETCTALEAKTAGAVRGGISNVSHYPQSLALMAFKDGRYKFEKREKKQKFQDRFETVEKVLKNETAGFLPVCE